MKPFSYLLKRNAINYIKSMKHKPTKIIPFVFYGIFLILMLFSLGNRSNSPDSFNNPKYFIAGCTLASFIGFLFIIYSGITRKNFRYSMSDVNIIFTSPIKSQNILLYGFLREVSFIFAFGIFFMFQIPNIANNFNFVSGGIPLFIIFFFLFAVTLSFISLLMYGIFSKLHKYRDKASKIAKAAILLVLLTIAIYIYTSSKGDYFNFGINFFNEELWNYIPIVGWIRSLLIQCIEGFNSSTILYSGLLLITCIISGVILYNLNLDFYEDALPSAEQNEVAQSYKNSGYDPKQLAQMNKVRKPLARRKTTMNYNAFYAKSIFFRHMLEYKKTGFYFLNILSGIYFVGSMIFGLYIKAPLYFFLLFAVYIMVIATYAGKWSSDFNGHYIFLIPASSASKLFYSTLSSIIKYLVDGLILFIPAGILTGSTLLEILLSILAYVSFGAISTYGAVLNYKLFDRVSNQMMKGIFMMITLFIFILPGIVVGLLLSFQLKIFGPYALHLSFIIYNTIASLVIIQGAKGIYDSIET
ncbi:putative ABC exporter domain-containing protein [Clostridium paraputrificum]|uniref:putative ABC exporter domain-containing protein n=1 Tax=Clostridium paraputrificum TaxID=29363 RepID=UPI003D32FFC4